MTQVSLQVVGCGEAFGAGGRMQSCFLLRGEQHTLVDCGATSLVAMRLLGIDPLAVQRVLITHFHADHFGGLPLIELDRKARGACEPVMVVGPPGVEEAYARLFGAMFPGSHSPGLLHFSSYTAHQPQSFGEWTVTAVPANHQPETHPHSLRLEAHGRVLAFSGDTEWTDELLAVARDADLFVCECVGFESSPRFHLHWHELSSRDLGCRRLMLTHMGEELLARLPLPGCETASDGLLVLL